MWKGFYIAFSAGVVSAVSTTSQQAERIKGFLRGGAPTGGQGRFLNVPTKLDPFDPQVKQKTPTEQSKRCHGSGTFPVTRMGQFYIGSQRLWA